MYDFWYDFVKPKYGRKCKIGVYGYRQFHCLHKNISYFKRLTLQKMLKLDLILQIMN